MPIYVYRCSHCGHQQDVLQKMSDPHLTVCPACGQSTYEKQVTAAGFRLKGSGWYETDFRGGGHAPSHATATSEGAATSSGEAPTSGGGTAPSPTPAASAKPVATPG